MARLKRSKGLVVEDAEAEASSRTKAASNPQLYHQNKTLERLLLALTPCSRRSKHILQYMSNIHSNQTKEPYPAVELATGESVQGFTPKCCTSTLMIVFMTLFEVKAMLRTEKEGSSICLDLKPLYVGKVAVKWGRYSTILEV